MNKKTENDKKINSGADGLSTKYIKYSVSSDASNFSIILHNIIIINNYIIFLK